MPSTPSERTQTVLVIGASGFLGRHVAQALLSDGYTVRCLARNPARIRELADAGCRVVQGDVLDAASVERAAESVQAVYVCIHTLSPQAATSPGQDFMGVELTGLKHIVGACQMQGTRRVIYVTFIGVSPDSPSAWVRGRWQTEQFLLGSGLDVLVLRPGMIVGRGGTGFEAVLSGARRPVATGMGSGRQQMRTVAVDDLAASLLDVLDDRRTFGQRYDVGSDDVLTMDQMIDQAADVLGRKRPFKVHLPRRLLGFLSPLIERAGRLPRGAFRGLVDSLPLEMSGDPAPIRNLHNRSFQSYRQVIHQLLNSS